MQKLNEFKLPYSFRGRSSIIVQLWWFVDFFFFKLSPQILYGWRRFLLRLFGARIGQHVLIRSSVTITYPWKLSIGDYSWIGDNVELFITKKYIRNYCFKEWFAKKVAPALFKQMEVFKRPAFF